MHVKHSIKNQFAATRTTCDKLSCTEAAVRLDKATGSHLLHLVASRPPSHNPVNTRLESVGAAALAVSLPLRVPPLTAYSPPRAARAAPRHTQTRPRCRTAWVRTKAAPLRPFPSLCSRSQPAARPAWRALPCAVHKCRGAVAQLWPHAKGVLLRFAELDQGRRQDGRGGGVVLRWPPGVVWCAQNRSPARIAMFDGSSGGRKAQQGANKIYGIAVHTC